MKRVYFVAVLLTALVAGCEKGGNFTDPDNLSPELRKVSKLIASAGDLQTSESKYEVKCIQADTLPGIIPNYVDPYTHSSDDYPARCVETTTEYDMVENPSEFVTLDPWSNLWPGALVQGASLAKGVPTLIPIYEKRKPGRIYLSMVSGNEDMDTWYREVPMRGSDVIQAQNELMAQYLGGSIPARTSFEIKTVHSVEEMAMKLGINLKLFGAKLSQEFGKSWNKQKAYVAVKLNQTFFTMAYEGPDAGFQGAFTDEIRDWELENYTGFGNPICYVGSVSYGRSFILLYESNYAERETEMAINAGYRSYANTNMDNTYKQILNETTCKMVQVGGNPEQGLATVFGDFDKLKTFIGNATVSKDNVGAPISYTIYHLRDNSFAQLSNTLKYSVTTKTYYPVEARNDVTIDVLSLQTSAPKPRDNDYKVSNYSTVKIKSIKAMLIDKTTGNIDISSSLLTSNHDMAKRGNIHGNDITLSGFRYYYKVNAKNRLKLDCIVEVHNEIYYGGRKQGTRDVLLTRTYECTDSGSWRAINNDDTSGSAFTSLKRSETIANANIDLELKIRFVQDGVVLE